MSSTIPVASSEETGSLGIKHLKRFWSKILAKKNQQIDQQAFEEEWTIDITLLNALGLGLEPTIGYLYQNSQNFSDFEDWVVTQNSGSIPTDRIAKFNSILDGNLEKSATEEATVLSPEDLAFWDENGYVIVRNAITREAALAAEDAVWDFLGMDKTDNSTWYTVHPDKTGIMVQFFNHAALQANRESPRIRKAFEELWGTTDLWVNTDRAGFNPPENESFKFFGPRLHWDVSLELPIPLGLQGILYLTDTAADQGALTVVPGFQNRIEDWIHSLPEGTNPRTQDLEALGAIPIAASAGDLIIWHQALPHGSRPNTNTYPRIVQYIVWQPVNPVIQKKWK
jgi:hypothetical protein